MSGAALAGDAVRRLPKISLHDHLDGGLRPSTIVELADASGYDGLPTTDADALGAWFREGADQGSLDAYLRGFDHTCAVTQTPEALHRVAREFVEDLHADGVVQAEVRFAPERHTLAGLSLDDVLEAVTDGFRVGSEATGVGVGTLVTIMRSGSRTVEVAELAVRWRDRTDGREGGVVGLDLAGPESGFPPEEHLAGFAICHAADLDVTIHAGEAEGVDSIRSALDPCDAARIGHGVRIVDDIDDDGSLGDVAQHVHDLAIPLELCPTSNLHTGAVPSLDAHPLPLLFARGFHVTLNPDDRLMSGITLSSEFQVAVDHWCWGPDEFRTVTMHAADALFLTDARRAAVRDRIAAAYDEVAP